MENKPKKDRFTLNLVLTEKCNLNCKYCYVNQNPKEMSYEVIDKTVEWLDTFVNDYELIAVELFGGEPLLALDKIKYFINKIQEKKYTNVYTSLFTNGLLFNNDEICKYVIDNIQSINFSIDGCEKAHNNTRIYHDGKGSFSDVVSGAKNFCKNEGTELKRLYCGLVVSPENCEFLMESAKELSDLGFTKINFRPIRDAVWTKDSLEKYKKAMYDLKDWYKNNIHRDIELSIFTLPLKIEKETRPRYCSGGKDFYSVNPEGDIYPCPRFYLNNSPYKLGSLFNKDYFSNQMYTNLFSKYTTSNYVNCSSCEEFKNKNCHGMCIAACYEDSKTLFTVIPEVCEIHKFNYKIAKEFENEMKDNIYYQKLLNSKN